MVRTGWANSTVINRINKWASNCCANFEKLASTLVYGRKKRKHGQGPTAVILQSWFYMMNFEWSVWSMSYLNFVDLPFTFLMILLLLCSKLLCCKLLFKKTGKGYQMIMFKVKLSLSGYYILSSENRTNSFWVWWRHTAFYTAKIRITVIHFISEFIFRYIIK